MARIPSGSPADPFPASARKSAFPYLFAAIFAASFVVSLRLAEVDPRVLLDGAAFRNVGRFVGGMFPPEVSPEFLGLMVRPAVETIQISVMGTLIAVLIGFPLGLLATSSLTWRGILHERSRGTAHWAFGVLSYALSRSVLSVFRSIPEYVWAFMFVRAVGLGPFPGVLAIGVAYGGMLGKVYSEILDGVNPRPLEALRAGGAGKLGIVLYGLVPEALPSVVSYTLYRWECAIRASAILGFVGAGGLGQQIELSMRMFQFNEVLTLLAILCLLVAGVDFVSGRIRARVVR
ncbi:MAG: phosphonate ABC transporter, permease protein PhnE [Candidatus Rokubacteria bacterium]|nr:phosphonate ABC transporter, permease protein PhnE [Candidatus Rokubacteria bacterium]